MRATHAVLPLFLLCLTSCTIDVGVSDVAACDGILQAQESTVDDVFDRDLDGYFDGNNAGCAATYDAELLDCDDGNPDANPIATEILCNNLDDDCNPATSDLDERSCIESYDGTWTLDQNISLNCAMGNVLIDFDRWIVNHSDPSIDFTPIGSGLQPGSMAGTVQASGAYSVTKTVPGGCTETYTIDGNFTSPNTVEGTFVADFAGGFNCLDCTTTNWNFTASR